jgi:hypothetical protein
MSHDPSSDRKRKAIQSPKESKALRMSLDSMTLSQIASHQGNASMSSATLATANKAFAPSAREHKASKESIGEKIHDLSGSNNVEVNVMIQDLFRSDSVKVYAALMELYRVLMKDSTTRNNLVAADGCRALVHLLNNCLQKAIDEIPACDQVTELNEVVELMILRNTLLVITNLTYRHINSRVGITAIDGVVAVVNVMKTFPKCQTLQERACAALLNLICNNVTGKNRAVKSDGIKIVLAAINNHLGSSILCRAACLALFNMILGVKKNMELLISLGGGAAIAKVKTKWPGIDDNCDGLLDYLAAQMTASQPTVRRSYKSFDVAISFASTAPGDTSASPTNPKFLSQSPLWIYHESSDGVSRSPKIPAVPSKSRNDSQLKSVATSELVSRQPKNDHNSKSTGAPEAVVLEAIGEGERNALRVVNRNAEAEDQIQSIGELIHHLLYSDNIKFDAALNALCVDLVEDPTKWDHFVAAVGCLTVIPIMMLLVVMEMIRW